MAYFPRRVRERFPDAIRSHRLRREIVATSIVNNMVNLAGISFDHRMTEDSGASVSDVARAFVASRDIFGFADVWREIDDLGSSINLDTQICAVPRRSTNDGTRHRSGCCVIDARRSTSAQPSTSSRPAWRSSVTRSTTS